MLVPFDLERPNLAWKHMWVRGVCPQPQGRGSSVVEFWGTSYMRADGTRKATKFWALIKLYSWKQNFTGSTTPVPWPNDTNAVCCIARLHAINRVAEFVASEYTVFVEFWRISVLSLYSAQSLNPTRWIRCRWWWVRKEFCINCWALLTLVFQQEGNVFFSF